MEEKKKITYKKTLFFILGLLSPICLLVILYIISTSINSLEFTILTFFSTIPLFVICLGLWFWLRRRNRALALGLLIGGISPFVFLFVSTGGCGLFLRY